MNHEYKKYFRKTSLKQKNIGNLFLKEIFLQKPKNFLEVGVFHGVTARNVCELLYSIHKDQFKYIGVDLFGENEGNVDEIIPNTVFSNPFKQIYFNLTKGKIRVISKAEAVGRLISCGFEILEFFEYKNLLYIVSK